MLLHNSDVLFPSNLFGHMVRESDKKVGKQRSIVHFQVYFVGTYTTTLATQTFPMPVPTVLFSVNSHCMSYYLHWKLHFPCVLSRPALWGGEAQRVRVLPTCHAGNRRIKVHCRLTCQYILRSLNIPEGVALTLHGWGQPEPQWEVSQCGSTLEISYKLMSIGGRIS